MRKEKIYEIYKIMDKAITWMRNHKNVVLVSAFLYPVLCILASFLLISARLPGPVNTMAGIALLVAWLAGAIVIVFGVVAQTSCGEEIVLKKKLLDSQFESKDKESIISRTKIASLEKSILVFRRLNLALADTYFIYPNAPLNWFINVNPCSPEKRKECAGTCPCQVHPRLQSENCDFKEMEDAIDFILPDFVVVNEGGMIAGAVFIDRTLSRWELHRDMKHRLLNDVLPKAGIQVLNIQTAAVPSVEKIREVFSNPASGYGGEQAQERDELHRVETYCPLCGQMNNGCEYLSADLNASRSAALGLTCCLCGRPVKGNHNDVITLQ